MSRKVRLMTETQVGPTKTRTNSNAPRPARTHGRDESQAQETEPRGVEHGESAAEGAESE
jgi:hypothetical protein